MRRLLVLAFSSCAALDNGLGRRPPMGYNSWYDLGCSPYMNATTIKRVADLVVSKGLAAQGYHYVNLDDCYIKDRVHGTLVPDESFGGVVGIKSLADYLHGKNLSFGLYTDRGDRTCVIAARFDEPPSFLRLPARLPAAVPHPVSQGWARDGRASPPE